MDWADTTRVNGQAWIFLGLQIYSKTINVPLIYRGIIFKDPGNMEKHGFPFTYLGVQDDH